MASHQSTQVWPMIAHNRYPRPLIGRKAYSRGKEVAMQVHYAETRSKILLQWLSPHTTRVTRTVATYIKHNVFNIPLTPHSTRLPNNSVSSAPTRNDRMCGGDEPWLSIKMLRNACLMMTQKQSQHVRSCLRLLHTLTLLFFFIARATSSEAALPSTSLWASLRAILAAATI